ncbi:MAG: type II toxin-antitoxin system prevent-host-death family antitoxin [Acidobacteria bacterium]|jgi:prevent-host-death family protein|nr:type II toxin-antitoxin system prevent-host-death family antitoxin [Acidobacteriota bacterium]
METVGIRDLKAHLSRHLRRVRAGARLLVTDRGRDVATISPVMPTPEAAEHAWARQLVADGRAMWSGGKPRGASGLAVTHGPSMAATVLDDRR